MVTHVACRMTDMIVYSTVSILLTTYLLTQPSRSRHVNLARFLYESPSDVTWVIGPRGGLQYFVAPKVVTFPNKL